jgi:RecA-family ATPase
MEPEGTRPEEWNMSESVLHRGTDMAESEPVTWRLAPGYLAAGKVNLLVGDEGIGKSLWTIRALASVTTGKPWGPFTIASDPADAILIATEDGWMDTIRPRLEVVEANLDPFSA